MVLFAAAAGAESGGLSHDQAEAEAKRAWAAYCESDTAKQLAAMMEDRAITHDGLEMPISVELIWDEGEPMPEAGYPVFISMHGGGEMTELENLDQWDIQKTRYPGVRGLYICPHSPLDTWDQWHNEAIFPLIDSLVQAVMLREDIDPNRVYLSGYCSGGNGVYQLGPILADHFAAVGAAKAFSEGAPLDNLRNCPIDLQWGEHDNEALNRPEQNRANVALLYDLLAEDPAGYRFREIEHWRQGRIVNDKSTVNWLARWTRDPLPQRVVWVQGGDVRASSNPIRDSFYWLALPEGETPGNDVPSRIEAQIDRQQQTITLEVAGYQRVRVMLNDAMLDLDQPITVQVNGQTVFEGRVERSADLIRATTMRGGDRELVFSASVEAQVPAADHVAPSIESSAASD